MTLWCGHRLGGHGLALVLFFVSDSSVALRSRRRPKDWKPDPPAKGTVTPSPWTLPLSSHGPLAPVPFCDQRTDKFLYSYDVPSNAGLVHRKLNLATLARDAFQLNRTLILGKMHTIIGTHNKGRPFINSWAKYVDLNGIQAALVDTGSRCKIRIVPLEQVPLQLIATKDTMQVLECRQVPMKHSENEPRSVTRDAQCGNQRGGLIAHNIKLDSTAQRTPMLIPPSPPILKLAQKIFEKFPGGSWYAHIRRTDAVEETKPCDVGKKPLGLATTGAALMPIFEKHIPKGSMVFMATDEPNHGVFQPLTKNYRILYEDDMRITDGNLTYPDPEDNYFTYAVSMAVQELFSESPGHKVLVADRNGDAGADVQVCNKEETTQRQGWWNLGP